MVECEQCSGKNGEFSKVMFSPSKLLRLAKKILQEECNDIRFLEVKEMFPEKLTNNIAVDLCIELLSLTRKIKHSKHKEWLKEFKDNL